MLLFPQRFPQEVGPIHRPTQQEIVKEPIMRRASVDFALKHGGDIARDAIARALAVPGLVTESTMVMVQRSPAIQYPTAPHWHVDFMPGTPGDLAEQLIYPTDGIIVNAQSDDLPTTQFLDGDVAFAETVGGTMYDGNSPLKKGDRGPMYWHHSLVEDIVQWNIADVRSLKPNTVYQYTSTDFHRPPFLQREEGDGVTFRVIIRINTPHPESPHEQMPHQDVILNGDEHVYFSIDPEDDSM